MSVLVVGGAGFIGSHICEELLKRGMKVVCADSLVVKNEKTLNRLKAMDGFSLYKTDASDYDRLAKVFEENDIECIYHLAANSDIQFSATKPEVEYINTYSTTFQVLQCMKRYGVSKMFFSSTSAIYGDKRDDILDEKTGELSPISYYGASKLGSEALIHSYSYMNDIRSIIFRFPNVVGSNLTHGVIYDFISKLRNDARSLEILGDGKQTKPYIHVGDLVEVILYLTVDNQWNTDEKVDIYNIGSKGVTSVNQIAQYVCEAMNLRDVTFKYTGGESGWLGDVPRFNYSTKKVESKGWKAKLSSNEAVKKAIEENINEEL